MKFVLKSKRPNCMGDYEVERYYTYVPSAPFEDKIFKDELMGDDYYRMGCSETCDFYAAIRVPK